MFNNGFNTQTPSYPNIPMYNGFTEQLHTVTGLDSAKAYPMQPNSTVALFNDHEDILYIKSTDASNFPTIRTFRFQEIDSTPPSENGKYVTIEDFNKFKEELLNGKQSVQQSNAQHSNGTNKTNASNRQGK